MESRKRMARVRSALSGALDEGTDITYAELLVVLTETAHWWACKLRQVDLGERSSDARDRE